MSTEKILQEIDIKFGEVLEMALPHQAYEKMLKILLGMLVETRNSNDYLKTKIERLERKQGDDTCQH
jgi:BMFP domain-containing protein YqiC